MEFYVSPSFTHCFCYCHPITQFLITHTLSISGDVTLVRWAETWPAYQHILIRSSPIPPPQKKASFVSEIFSSKGYVGPKASSANIQAVKNQMLPLQNTARILGWRQRSRQGKEVNKAKRYTKQKRRRRRRENLERSLRQPLEEVLSKTGLS